MPLIETPPDAVAITYANALYTVVSPKGQAAVEQTLSELEAVMELARSDRRFNEFLASRIIPAAQRAVSIEKMFMGKISETTVRFLQVLNNKGRLFTLPGVVESFDAIAQKSFGRVEVSVTTASPLSEGDQQMLASQLHAKLGQQPVLHCAVDEAILGGIRIQIGDQLIDASLSSRLGQIREAMTSRGAAKVRAAAERIFKSESSNGHH